MRIRITTASLLFLLFGVLAYGGIISRIHTFSDGDTLTAAQLNAEFDNVVNGVNSIDNSNISTSAAISPTKISAGIAGTGITRNGTTGALTPTVDGTSIDVGGLGLEVVPDNSTIERNASGIRVKDQGIVTAKIADLNVTTGKLADASVTQGKRAALGQQVSTASGAYTRSTHSFADVTNLSVSITTTGRPVFVGLISKPATSYTDIVLPADNSGSHAGIKFQSDGSDISEFQNDQISVVSVVPCSAFAVITVPTAATHTIKVQAQGNGSSVITIRDCELVAYEL